MDEGSPSSLPLRFRLDVCWELPFGDGDSSMGSVGALGWLCENGASRGVTVSASASTAAPHKLAERSSTPILLLPSGVKGVILVTSL